MTITKCDVCKKTIERSSLDEQRAHITLSYPYLSFEFCLSCTGKLLPILQKKFHLSIQKVR